MNKAPELKDIKPVSHLIESSVLGPCLEWYVPIGVSVPSNTPEGAIAMIAWESRVEPIRSYDRAITDPEWEIFT